MLKIIWATIFFSIFFSNSALGAKIDSRHEARYLSLSNNSSLCFRIKQEDDGYEEFLNLKAEMAITKDSSMDSMKSLCNKTKFDQLRGSSPKWSPIIPSSIKLKWEDTFTGSSLRLCRPEDFRINSTLLQSLDKKIFVFLILDSSFYSSYDPDPNPYHYIYFVINLTVIGGLAIGGMMTPSWQDTLMFLSTAIGYSLLLGKMHRKYLSEQQNYEARKDKKIAIRTYINHANHYKTKAHFQNYLQKYLQNAFTLINKNSPFVINPHYPPELVLTENESIVAIVRARYNVGHQCRNTEDIINTCNKAWQKKLIPMLYPSLNTQNVIIAGTITQ